MSRRGVVRAGEASTPHLADRVGSWLVAVAVGVFATVRGAGWWA